MKKTITQEKLKKVIALKNEGLPATTIALRLAVHVSTIRQALRGIKK